MLQTWSAPAQGVHNVNSRGLLCTDAELGFVRSLNDWAAANYKPVPPISIKDGVFSVQYDDDPFNGTIQAAELDYQYQDLRTHQVSYDSLVWEVRLNSPSQWVIDVGIAYETDNLLFITAPHMLVCYQILWGASVLAPSPSVEFEEWLMIPDPQTLVVDGGPLLVTFGLDDFYSTQEQANLRLPFLQALFETHYDEHAGLKAEAPAVAKTSRVRKS